MANTVGRDSGSVTAANLRNIEHEFGKDPWVTTATGLSSVYKPYVIPDVDKWRLPLLMKLLDQRRVQFACDEDTSHLNPTLRGGEGAQSSSSIGESRFLRNGTSNEPKISL